MFNNLNNYLNLLLYCKNKRLRNVKSKIHRKFGRTNE